MKTISITLAILFLITLIGSYVETRFYAVETDDLASKWEVLDQLENGQEKIDACNSYLSQSINRSEEKDKRCDEVINKYEEKYNEFEELYRKVNLQDRPLIVKILQPYELTIEQRSRLREVRLELSP